MNEPSDRIRGLGRQARTTERLLRVLSEAGLFTGPASEHLPAILTQLDRGRRALAGGQAEEADDALLRAATSLDSAVHQKALWWRLVYVHRALLFLYLTAVFFALLNVGSGFLDWVAVKVWHLPVAALGFGAAGATLRSLYWLHRQVAQRIFRSPFALAHLAAPLIGALLGMFTYLLVKGGMLVLAGQSPDLEGESGPLVLCFLAGFSWEWLLSWVDGLRAGSGAQRSRDAGAGNRRGAAPPADDPDRKPESQPSEPEADAAVPTEPEKREAVSAAT